MLDEMYQEYVRTARAKGVSQQTILFRHVLRNAMIPILTNVIIAIPFLYTGALLLENFFGIPGLGRMTVTALFNGDEDVIFASVFIGSILYVIANVVTDIAYTWADPRIRLK
jgi:peptide/nickel transport system permease protein